MKKIKKPFIIQHRMKKGCEGYHLFPSRWTKFKAYKTEKGRDMALLNCKRSFSFLEFRRAQDQS